MFDAIPDRYYESYQMMRDPGIHGDECMCDDCFVGYENDLIEEEEDLENE